MSAPRPILLDLFCGAGGAGTGYARAGFDVLGVDLDPQPNYPFEFTQADWQEPLRYLPGLWEREGRPYAIHASPPCQAYTWGTRTGREEKWPRLISDVRDVLALLGAPYVIENVEQAAPDMREPILLCGQMFGLRVVRHRLFEFWPEESRPIFHPAHPRCQGAIAAGRAYTVAGHGGNNKPGGYSLDAWRVAMDMPWVQTKHEITEAIPPAYTEWLAPFLLSAAIEAAPALAAEAIE